MALITVVIVDPDGVARKTKIENSLGSFQSVVGGYIEGVFGTVATIYVNEEGLLRGLPHNPLATSLANDILGAGVSLHGTALIVGPGDGEGNDTSVRQTVVDYYNLEN